MGWVVFPADAWVQFKVTVMYALGYSLGIIFKYKALILAGIAIGILLKLVHCYRTAARVSDRR
jgi:hypothetical protein